LFGANLLRRKVDHLYLRYRIGRWIVGSHTATLMNSPSYQPFFDNRVVREALALPAEWRHSEEPFYHLIRLLEPSLAEIPPEGKRWRFERERPRRLAGWRAWRSRAAVTPVGRTAGFNWRKQYDEGFQSIMREQILGGPRELLVNCSASWTRPASRSCSHMSHRSGPTRYGTCTP
jgi:hypothetical protein